MHLMVVKRIRVSSWYRIGLDYFSKFCKLRVLFFRQTILFGRFRLVAFLVKINFVTYAFQSESTLYSYLNVKELLAWSKSKMWRLRDWNWTRTNNHLVHKRTLKDLAKLAKWLSCVVSAYLYSVYVSVKSRTRFKVNFCIFLHQNWTNSLMSTF